MSISQTSNEKPIVGFFPEFDILGETYPLIKIAKCYKELGGEVVFFSHGGRYENLASRIGCKIIRIKPLLKFLSETRYPDIEYFMEHPDGELIDIVKRESMAYNKTGVRTVVQGTTFFCSLISTRVAKIPLITIVSGTIIPPYFKANYATYPDEAENFFTYIIPKHIKNRITNWHSLKFKGPMTKKFNRIAKKCQINHRFRCFNDLLMGDYTFVCDDIEFLGLKATREFPVENYIGSISADDLFEKQENQVKTEIENHINRSKKTILVSMGSSCDKEFFLKILKVLNKTKYNVIAISTNILKEKEFPILNDNILLKKFVPSITKLNQIVDLVVIHGGRGTTHTAAYSGKPVIGIPMQAEQHLNLDNLVRHGVALRLSKTFFKEKNLLNAIEEIFANYDKYLNNAQALAQKLPKPEGDKNAARRVVEILQQGRLT